MNDPISFQAILKTHVRQQNQPEGNILAFMGVIALQQGDRASALKAFEAAMEAFDILLDHSDTNYGALDAKGLAMYEGKSKLYRGGHSYVHERPVYYQGTWDCGAYSAII